MKQVRLLHNPSAGDEEHSMEHLAEMIEKSGFECKYSSVKKKGWKEFENGLEILAIAGGDGTVRKVVKAMLSRKMHEKIWPIGLIPLGTANNIGKTLGLAGKGPEHLISSWKEGHKKKFDVGMLYDLEDASFFLESFGFGIFPYLMREIKKEPEHEDLKPGESITNALRVLHSIILEYEPRNCRLIIDGKDHSGKYIMAEIMNTQSIGPNLHLAPFADPGDGTFEIVLIPEGDKQRFGKFVWERLEGSEKAYHYSTIKGRNVEISWDGTHVHVDDEVLKIPEDTMVKVEMREGLLEFVV